MAHRTSVSGDVERDVRKLRRRRRRRVPWHRQARGQEL